MPINIPNETLQEMENSLVAFRYVALSNDPEKELPAAPFHYQLSDLLLKDKRNIAIRLSDDLEFIATFES